ncbi:MAG: SIMPL domain-containing protein [Mycobacteriaceae bacterium]|nr:SIMPL domain-containing protein [Mycobacteriaceae bacterium]
MRMRRAGQALLPAALAGMLLAGCSDSDSDSKGDAKHEVTVVGHGQVRGAPDILNADIGVEVNAPEVSAALSQANDRANAMITAITAAGVAKADVRTTAVDVHPEYSTPGPAGGPHAISGYQASNTVHVVVRDLAKASKVLDDAVRAGGNNARLSSVAFAIDDKSKLLSDARAKAFDDAKHRAEQYAALAGMKLGRVVTISETSSGRGDLPVPAAPEYKADSAVPLEPGTQQISFTVNATWSLV